MTQSQYSQSEQYQAQDANCDDCEYNTWSDDSSGNQADDAYYRAEYDDDISPLDKKSRSFFGWD